MRRAESARLRRRRRWRCCSAAALPRARQAQPACDKPVYLTFDTGHMGVAPLIADVLKRQQVQGHLLRRQRDAPRPATAAWATHWAPWWKARAAEGHEFASHTWDHVYWRADLPRRAALPGARLGRADAGRELDLDRRAVLRRDRHSPPSACRQITGKKPLPLFRAPGGKTSPRCWPPPSACGYEHVGWSPAGFLGDELPSETLQQRRSC